MQGWQRVGALTELPGIVSELGGDPAAVAAAAGLERGDLLDREHRIPFAAACMLVKAAIDATGCEHLPLHIGMRNGTESLGLVGALMRNAPTWGRAFLDLCENQHRYVRGGVPYLIIQDGYAFSGYAIYDRTTPFADYFQEGAVAVGAHLMREICGFRPEEVHLPRREPADQKPWRDYFGCPVRFNASQAALVYPVNHLGLPALRNDPAQRAALEEKVRNYWAIDLPRMSDQVVRLLRPRVVTGEARLEVVAAALNMHERQLGRALQAEGTNFRALLKATQIDVAQRLLRSTDLSITEVGAALGYGDTSAFSNAFRRETGATPSGWRSALARGVAVALDQP